MENPQDRLIVALDVATKAEAVQLVEDVQGDVSFFKVGYQLFIAEGMPFVRSLIDAGKRVFLDLKMHDIGETIALSVQEIANTPISFLTISGDAATVAAACRGRGQRSLPKILFVPLLTSSDARGLHESLSHAVMWRAKQTMDAGADGLIVAGPHVAALRARYPQATLVTPGVRLEGESVHEHKRVTTPRDAIAAGADYIVVGRPIKNAPNRRAMARAIIDDIKQGARA